MNTKIVITGKGEETKALGQETIKIINSRHVIALYGELGSGKTTFVQGLAKGLGIRGRITSPTFTIIRKHQFKTQSPKAFYHIDLYRLDRKEEIKDLGMEEIFNDPKNIIAVEWAEKIKDQLPEKRIEIYFEYLNHDQRKIRIEIN